MTVEELITKVLDQVWHDHYKPLVREFCRDKRAILKCISRYGHHCLQRGWHLDPAFIHGEIMRVLRNAREKRADIQYLPAYLDVGLTKALGARAEELREAAMNVKRPVARVLRDASTGVVTAVLQPTAVEVLDTLYKSLKKSKAKAAPRSRTIQGELL